MRAIEIELAIAAAQAFSAANLKNPGNYQTGPHPSILDDDANVDECYDIIDSFAKVERE
jgi:hypothetical protein